MVDRYSPVVVFVYNRPQHTQNLLDCLNNLEEAKYTELFIFSDGPKEVNDENVMNVRKVINTFASNSNFRNVQVFKSRNNKGLATSIIEGVTKVINRYESVIVLEDDLEVSRDFLSYMNDAIKVYKDNERIWSISAYSFPMKALKDYKHDVYLSGRGCSWGWATWKDRWNSVDWTVSHYREYKFNMVKRHSFALWGRDLPCMLDAYVYNEIHSWAIRWCFAAHLQKMYTVYPVVSRILNKGTDGSGTNYNKIYNTKYDTELSHKTSCNFEDVAIDYQIQKEFAKKYLSILELIKVSLRWLLIKIGILKPHTK